jgi:hypothetical protein
MYRDIIFSLSSDTTIGGANLKPGNYRLVMRANKLIIWDAYNWYVTEIKDQIEFDELVLAQSLQVIETIHATLVAESEVQILEHKDGHVYVFGPNIPFKKSFIEKLIEDGTLVPQ